ncbi:MAG: helix-turn-helix domain-containing protein [Bacteroidota bacterium]
MKDRIKEFIDYKGISAGELADLLDVQRSNISHILNGRNKPGAVFLKRFLLSFPEVNARWLLTGEGQMVNVNPNNQKKSLENTSETKYPKAPQLPFDEHQANKMDIEKVILLYADGSFSSYTAK